MQRLHQLFGIFFIHIVLIGVILTFDLGLQKNTSDPCYGHWWFKKNCLENSSFMVQTMIFLLDGNSEIRGHLRSNLLYIICLTIWLYQEQSRIVFLLRKDQSYFMRVQHVLSNHLIYVARCSWWIPNEEEVDEGGDEEKYAQIRAGLQEVTQVLNPEIQDCGAASGWPGSDPDTKTGIRIRSIQKSISLT